jgi:DNA sulfur modification protein DndC
MGFDQALDITAQSLNAYGEKYDHWAIAYSGGKDSSAVVSATVHLIEEGRVNRPKSLTVLMSDTRMELPPLHASAMAMLAALRERGFSAQVVYPAMDDRMFVYMFGRGVPPPSNTFRWCTPQLKVEPMLRALTDLRNASGKLLMLTGVRLGESAVRDARIALSCGKNGAECGQGWFQEATPEAIADTLAPILHWRVCFVWDWLYFENTPGLPTRLVAEAYGGDEAQEINARTGCVGCNLASRDFALETILTNPKWAHLQPLMELRPLWAELKKPHNRIRKDGSEKRKDGTLVSNPCRMGPLTMEARLMGLERIKDIQARASVDLINQEEEARILELITANTWPDRWNGEEPRADLPFDNVNPDGSVQPVWKVLL